ncbi:MAG: hypothetical protein OXU20_39815, partial [Myxococcales bacterium]|nr:hypothetical protein [Myxococcales bacterium]
MDRTMGFASVATLLLVSALACESSSDESAAGGRSHPAEPTGTTDATGGDRGAFNNQAGAPSAGQAPGPGGMGSERRALPPEMEVELDFQRPQAS